MRFLYFLVVGYLSGRELFSAERANGELCEKYHLSSKSNQVTTGKYVFRPGLSLSMLNVAGLSGMGRFLRKRIETIARGGRAALDRVGEGVPAVNGLVKTSEKCGDVLAPYEGYGVLRGNGAGERFVAGGEEDEEGGGACFIDIASASGDDNGESEGRSLLGPRTVSMDFFEYADSFQGEVEEGEDSLAFILDGMEPFFLEEEAEEKRKWEERKALAELERQLEEQQVARKRDREKPLLGRGGVKVVPFNSFKTVLVVREAVIPFGALDQDTYNKSAAGILFRCNREEVAARMLLNSEDIDAVFPVIQEKYRFIAPRLASEFFIIVRCFITNYKEDAEKQKNLTVLLANIFRMGCKIPPHIQSQISTGVYDRMSNFDSLVPYMKEWGNAVKSDGENGKMTPNQY